MAHKGEDELLKNLQALRGKISVGDKYCHYKHPDKYYSILAIGFIEATEEPCIVYQAEYGDRFVWIRTESEFFAKVTLEDGTMVDRFTKVS